MHNALLLVHYASLSTADSRPLAAYFQRPGCETAARDQAANLRNAIEYHHNGKDDGVGGEQMTCDHPDCKKPAVFRTERPDRSQQKCWCEKHFADKVTKYELKVQRVR